MRKGNITIGVVATGSRLDPAAAERVASLAASLYRDEPPEIRFHPQCFSSAGHFAGDDETRASAFLEVANDPEIDALWFARGGYGACRLGERVLPALTAAARQKLYLGYSDAGFLLAGLYRAGFPDLAHGPMVTDINRPGGEAAVGRALAFLVDRAGDGLEPTVAPGLPTAAFNITVLCHLLGTPLEPDLAGHVLMLEEVGEQMYRTDRALFQLTSNPALRRLAGIRLGRCSNILPNDPAFGQGAEEVVRHWCGVSGIAYLGSADIGHDIDNKIVPFGRWRPGRPRLRASRAS
jgi:muramoyltetrapeptide carboxypeptidase